MRKFIDGSILSDRQTKLVVKLLSENYSYLMITSHFG